VRWRAEFIERLGATGLREAPAARTVEAEGPNEAPLAALPPDDSADRTVGIEVLLTVGKVERLKPEDNRVLSDEVARDEREPERLE
jgi:hypothetical protein